MADNIDLRNKLMFVLSVFGQRQLIDPNAIPHPLLRHWPVLMLAFYRCHHNHFDNVESLAILLKKEYYRLG